MEILVDPKLAERSPAPSWGVAEMECMSATLAMAEDSILESFAQWLPLAHLRIFRQPVCPAARLLPNPRLPNDKERAPLPLETIH